MKYQLLISSLLVAGLATAALAGNVTALDGSQGWYVSDQRLTSSSTIVATPSNDGDGSLELRLNSSSERSAVDFFGAGNGLGTLGALANGSLSFDYMRSTADDLVHQIAVKLYFTTADNKSGSLNWEEVYNNNGATEADGVWTVGRNVGAEKFWLRYGTTNHDTYSNFQTLSSWAGGYQTSGGAEDPAGVTLAANTEITGIEFGAGSGWGSHFTGYADHLSAKFSGGSSYSSNFQAVPEPATWACLGLGAALVARRRRAKA